MKKDFFHLSRIIKLETLNPACLSLIMFQVIANNYGMVLDSSCQLQEILPRSVYQNQCLKTP